MDRLFLRLVHDPREMIIANVGGIATEHTICNRPRRDKVRAFQHENAVSTIYVIKLELKIVECDVAAVQTNHTGFVGLIARIS